MTQLQDFVLTLRQTKLLHEHSINGNLRLQNREEVVAPCISL